MLEKYVEDEFYWLKEKYGPEAFVKKVCLDFRNSKFFGDFKNTIETDRRGEVGFLLKRTDGKYVVVRSRKYPKNVYRIPTGGINFSEKAEDALYREVKEELGVKFEIESFKGLIEYEIRFKEEKIKFYSYLFEIKEISGVLIKDATEDEISDYKEIDFSELEILKENLENARGQWKDWSAFRSELIKFYLNK